MKDGQEMNASAKMELLNVVQANELVSSAYVMTIDERRLLLLAITKIRRHLERSKELFSFEISIKEWQEMYGIGNPYSRLKTACLNLMQRRVIFKNEGYNEAVNWLDSCVYRHDQSMVSLRFSYTMSKYLAEMSQEFTQYNLLDIKDFKSINSIRIYELCCQFKNPDQQTGWRQMKIEELKEALCLQGKYKRLTNFTLRVIDPALKEINEKSNLKVSVKYKKTGQKITDILFQIGTIH